MENNGEQPNDKKLVNKARSCNNASPTKLKGEPAKWKSFNVNEAVRSLDLALGRLKKSKLVNGDFAASRGMNPAAQGASDMFMDICTSSTFRSYPGTENASLMSMNFSHYELMRNVSRCNCNSDEAFSDTTCSSRLSPADLNLKDEHLERYFRSVEMWSHNYRNAASSMNLDLSDK
ncbi:hypothetical protein HF086_005752 [Spodoptera exigua]|uniref:Uncharacterized protein n=1 Tax=Spodoptera exigua TaxID=7107 RepID=A0A922MYI4_SPOEX|nr:hypothetical protein HF086_005752 [Spodoptera exigua]